MNDVLTPLSIWKDIDFSLPFDEGIVSQRTEEDITEQKLYFTGRKIGDTHSRVYAVIAYKKLPAPCIICVGRLDRRVDTDFIKYWAKQGYCVMGIDYGGNLGEGAHTIYPDEISYANYYLAKRHLTNVDQTVYQTTWFEYDYNTKRAIQYLFDHNMVENDNCGIVSYGEESSTVAIHLLGTDKRLKTGIIMFGSIWEDARKISDMSGIENYDISKKVEETEEEERYLLGICKQSYLQYVTQPIYLISSANTWGTSLSQNFAAMARCPNRNSKAVFVPNYVDKAPRELFGRIVWWFDYIFNGKEIPKKPKLRIFTGKSGVSVSVMAKSANIYYSQKVRGQYIYWQEAETTRTEESVKAKIVAYPDTESIAVYATVIEDDLVMSSAISYLNFTDDDNVARTRRDRLLYSFKVRETQFVPLLINNKESYSPVDEVEQKVGAFGLSGICGKEFGTFALSEYPFNEATDTFLAFDAYSPQPQKVIVKLVANWSKENRAVFSQTVQLVGGEVWQKVKLELRDFKFDNSVLFDNKILQQLEVLCFSAQEKFCVNNILFG